LLDESIRTYRSERVSSTLTKNRSSGSSNTTVSAAASVPMTWRQTR
jgi:hypothetical protein